MQSIRYKRAGDYRLTAYFQDSDGEPADPSDLSVEVVSDITGETVFEGSVTSTGGEATAKVDNEALLLGGYTAIWTGTLSGEETYLETPFEVVGGYLFEVADMRAFDDAYASESAERIGDAREWATERAEAFAGVAFAPRVSIEEVELRDGKAYLSWPRIRRIVAVEVDGDPYTGASDFDRGPRARTVRLESSGRWARIAYEHGYDRTPEPVKHAAILLANEWLTSNLASRATGESTDVGFLRYTYATEDDIGIPEVTAVLKAEKKKHESRWGVA